jgi:hypothetical protein
MNRRHTRYFYPVGLLSLVFLPLMLVWDITQTESAKPKSTLEVNLFPLPSKWDEFMRQHPLIAADGRWSTFRFAGNPKADQAILDSAKAAIRLHRSRNDTVNGIVICFHRATRYDAFVRLLDFFAVEGVSRYAIIDSNLWIPREPLQSELLEWRYTGPVCGGVQSSEPPAEPDRQLRRLVESYGFLSDAGHRGPLAVIGIVWLAIALLNAFRLRRLRRAG